MDEFFTIFLESNITLSNEQKVKLNRFVENLINAVKVNPDKNDELIMRSKEYEELARFVSSIFQINKKNMSEFVWRTIIAGVIGGARKIRDY